MDDPEKKNIGKQWSYLQDLHYHFSLILNQSFLDSNKKETRFFVKVKGLLRKSGEQCRTHHDKKMKQIKKIAPQGQKDHYLLYKFYFENIKIRKLDEAHLKLEIEAFLDEKIKQAAKQSQQRKCFIDYKENLDDCLRSLDLQRNYSKYSEGFAGHMEEESPQGSRGQWQQRVWEEAERSVREVGYESMLNIPESFHLNRSFFEDEQNSFFKGSINSEYGNLQLK